MSTPMQVHQDLTHNQDTIVFILDLRDPFSYLALGPAIDFSRATPISSRAASVDWLPVRKHTLLPPSTPSPGDDRSILHRRARAQMIAREIAIYADVQGITVGSPYRDGPADAAYAAWLWVRATAPEQLPAFLQAIFEAYWADGLDPEKDDEALPLLERLGLDSSEFKQWAATQSDTVLRSLESQLGEAGVSQAPACLIEDEIFYGRQHLPMIRWILEGRPGAGPI